MFYSILIGFLWYQIISVFGISAGLHRYFSHKQFKAGPIYETIALFMAMLAGSRSPIGWIGAHRIHHVHADTDKDPHSPDYKGWVAVIFNLWTIKSIPRKFIKDCLKNPRLVWFHKHWKKLYVFMVIFSLLISLEFFVAFVFMPWILGYIGYGLFNYLGHKNKKPTNNWFINILAAGEGFHEPHHKNINLVRLHKYDFTGWVIEKFFQQKRFTSKN